MSRYILSIETSCDETACAILSPNAIQSEVVYSQVGHAHFGGVVPEMAARDHQSRLPLMVKELLESSGVRREELCEIAYTHGPGLAGSLLVGHYYALGLASALNIPLRGIHHLEGHIMSAFITHGQGSWSERFLASCPAIVLIVSGGHTLFVEVKKGAYTLLGETRDDAVGEIFDKIARIMGLAYPGGAALSKLAAMGRPIYPLPRPMTERNDAEMSFSGLKTAARMLYERLNLKDSHLLNSELHHQTRCDFAASFEQAIIDTLMYKVRYLMKTTGIKNFVVGGGVGANRTLREALLVWCEKENIRCILPEPAYCGDNASMIGVAAWIRKDLQASMVPPAFRLHAELAW